MSSARERGVAGLNSPNRGPSHTDVFGEALLGEGTLNAPVAERRKNN
jgi:hypothetical protein